MTIRRAAARVLFAGSLVVSLAPDAVDAQPTRLRLSGPEWLIGSGAIRCDVGQRWDLVIEARDANLQQVDPRRYPPQVSSSNEAAVPVAWDGEWNLRIVCEGDGVAEVRVEMAGLSTCLPVLSGASRNATPPPCATTPVARLNPAVRAETTETLTARREETASLDPPPETTVTLLPNATIAGTIPGPPAATVDSIYNEVAFLGFEIAAMTGQSLWDPNAIPNWAECLFAMNYNRQFVCPGLVSHLRYPVQTGVSFTVRLVLLNSSGMRVERPGAADIPVNWATANNYLGGSCATLQPGAKATEVKVTIQCTPQNFAGLSIQAEVPPPIIPNLSRNKPALPRATLMGVILRPGSII